MNPTQSHLLDTMRADLTTAIRERDELTSSTLRMVLTAVTVAEAAGATRKDLGDEEVLAVLRSEAKKRRESATTYAEAGREDRAERETAEAEVIRKYLPAEMSDSDLIAAVKTAVETAAANGKQGMAAMGAVMGALRTTLGSNVEGGRLSAEVRRQLSAPQSQ